jgi:hypothetical protein
LIALLSAMFIINEWACIVAQRGRFCQLERLAA